MAQTNRITLGVNYRKVTSVKSPAYGKYYAEVDRPKTLTTDGLAAHIAAHGCALGAEAVKGVLVIMSNCIPELISQGQPVKIDGLGTFSAGIKNFKNGATEAQMQDSDFNPTTIVKGVKINFRPDGAELKNITSKNFLQSMVSLESRYIVTGKESDASQVRTPLHTFRAPAQEPQEP